jgi:hypothetical protein
VLKKILSWIALIALIGIGPFGYHVMIGSIGCISNVDNGSFKI